MLKFGEKDKFSLEANREEREEAQSCKLVKMMNMFISSEINGIYIRA